MATNSFVNPSDLFDASRNVIGALLRTKAEFFEQVQGAPESLDSECSVLVPSCDAYSDLWMPFFDLFWRYWPDCPFPVFLGTNRETFAHPRVTILHNERDTDWSNQVRAELAALGTPYVLLMLEDFFLRRPVNTQDILACLEALQKQDGHMIRLVTRPKPDVPVPSCPLIGAIIPGAPYRVSAQAAIWRRETLLNLMRPSESIWQFEMDGSRRSDKVLTGFFAVWRSALPYDHHVVERGKWFRHEASRFGRMNIGCDFTRRPIMTPGEMLRWYATKLKGILLELLPWQQRLRLVRWIKSLAR